MKNYFIAVLISFSLVTTTLAQEQTNNRIARNNLYVELLGNGFLYSLNYERFFRPQFSLRTGAMFFTGNGKSFEGRTLHAVLVIFPVMFNRLISFGSHHIELGVGPQFVYLSARIDNFDKEAGFAIGGTARIGYLYFPSDGGFNFRVAYTPLLSEVFSHSVGIGIGYAF